VDLEKAFDRVPTEMITWAMHKLGVEEWLVSAVMSMYTDAKTLVRTVYGNSNDFEVKVNIHSCSVWMEMLMHPSLSLYSCYLFYGFTTTITSWH